jgi:Family of unknown function (DUF6441)
VKLAASITRSLQADMQVELRNIEPAVMTGTRDADRGLKTDLRRQVTSAGLGQRLANSWRDKHYPNQQLDAASLVYTKAPQIIRAFDEGAVIRSTRGRFLAIPTGNAPRRGIDGKRISPSTFPEHRFGPSVRASAERTIAPGRGRLASISQSQNRRAPRLPARRRARSAQRPGSDHGPDVPARAGPPPFPPARTKRGIHLRPQYPEGLALYGIAPGGAERAEERHVGFIEAVADAPAQQEWRLGRR